VTYSRGMEVAEPPAFSNDSERVVWEHLREQLDADDLLISSLRLTDRKQDHELDYVVGLVGHGFVVLEVKGSDVRCEPDGRWTQRWKGRRKNVDPVAQARGGMYALREYVDADERWGRRRVRWAHAVVLPFTDVDDSFATPDCPRWAIAGRNDMDRLVLQLRDVLDRQRTANPPVTVHDVVDLSEILRGRMHPQADLVAAAAEHEAQVDRLTQQQAMVLSAIRLLHRVEIRGGAGSGKTWLAIEQARRMAQQGQRVALLCYSRGLARFMQKRVETLPRRQRPAYVGTFHYLGDQWGATLESDDDSDFWERRLPAQMVNLADVLPTGKKFDAVVVDEAQDFADAWWPALLAALRDEEAGGVYVFTDEGQRVFARFGGPPIALVPLVLDQNLRNTRQIADTFSPLAPMRMRLAGGEGPDVRFVECRADEAVDVADDEVDRLIDVGWRPEDIALLTTRSRHPEQKSRQEEGQESYWESFWDADQVFYGHVLGFKGLERRVVVLALNEAEPQDRSRERLYVGLSRARDQLVVCGDPAYVETVGGHQVLKQLLRDNVFP
jgi:Nuclease-related domain/UvrD-like helicase C-terminal domain/AAA domain